MCVKDLSFWIIEDLKKSGLCDSVINEMKIEDVKVGKAGSERLKAVLGFSKFDNNSILQTSDCYIIPYPDENFARVKLRYKIGDAKYLSPKKGMVDTAFHLYFLPEEKEKLGKQKYALVITEGEKKAAKLTQELRKMEEQKKAVAVGIPGIAMWRDCPEWQDVRLSGRDVFICFDSDVVENADVQYQMLCLFLFLRKHKANVRIIIFDKGKGIDDHLVMEEENGKSTSGTLSKLFDNAEENIFSILSNVDYYKLTDAMASSYYSIEEDSKALWDKFKLNKQYGIHWGTFKKLLSRAYKEKNKQSKQTEEKESPGNIKNGKPVIEIVGGKLPEMVDEAEKSLLASGEKIYQRSGFLVRIIETQKSPKGINRQEKVAMVIKQVEESYLIELFTKTANWVKYDARMNGYKDVDCPPRVADVYLARGEWKVPVLSGIIHAPTLRPDGSILEKTGYDEATGLLLCPGDTIFPLIPQEPTKADAHSALEKLKSLLKEFPFVKDEKNGNFATILSAFLTALVRRSLRSAPGHALTAPKMGSGKTLLADLIALLATGRNVSKISQAKSPEEEQKILLALLMEGDPVVCIDNVEDPLGSDALCTILSEDEWRSRLLGQSKMVPVPTNVTWIATGNNLRFHGDLSTRFLLCSLDPGVEHPEEREFEVKDIREYTLANRGDLVCACLTILRAYHVVGSPKQNIKPYGRFEEWSDLIRSALVWLGIGDPCVTREKIEESDPVREELKALFSAWYNAIGDDKKTLKEIVQLAEMPGKEDLKEALVNFSGDKTGNLNIRTFAQKLKKFQGRIEGGYQLVHTGTVKNIILWKVKKIIG